MKKLVLHMLALLFAFVVLSPTSANAVVYDPENEEKIYTYLTEVMELNEAVAAGILANIEHESWFDPTAGFADINGYTSYGICQWNGYRFDALRAFCAERGLDYTTLEGQLPYLQFELEGAESYAYGKIKDVPNTVDGAYTAGYNWAKYFERCVQYWNGVDQFASRGILAEEKYWQRSEDTVTFTLRFNADGGSCERTYKQVLAGSTAGRIPVPVREGYSFNGWQLPYGGYLTESTVVGENMTVTAQWNKLVVSEPSGVFDDVYTDDYFCTPVLWAVDSGITSGTSATTFSPNAPCTRGQIVTFLWRAAGSPAPKMQVHPFVDIAPTDYYYTAVLWAVEQGITAGTTSQTFSPDAPCTRGQVAVFLWNANGRPAISGGTAPFTDVYPADYYHSAVLWAAERAITGGVGDGRFGPNLSCTRGQIVTFLYKAFSY